MMTVKKNIKQEFQVKTQVAQARVTRECNK